LRNLIIIIAVVVAVLIVRSLVRSSPHKAAKFLQQLGLVAGVGLLLFLLATGRLPVWSDCSGGPVCAKTAADAALCPVFA
jgi:hypothetical protein